MKLSTRRHVFIRQVGIFGSLAMLEIGLGRHMQILVESIFPTRN